MRLLQINSNGDLSLVEYFGNDIPPYAILSHTWGADEDEISFKDVKKGRARGKASGYRKIRFCGEQALRDGIHLFWVDTCCIKQESSQDVGEAINSMYRWYHNAVTCYVYLADVAVGNVMPQDTESEPAWILAFRSSRWFTRGWTLQELLAPVSIEFYSKDGYRLGDRTTLLPQIQWITGIPEAALRGSSLSDFAVEERISWARKRITKREEDAAYSLLGLFGIHMPLIYGEGRRNALKRLQREIVRASREEPLSPMLSLSSVVLSSTTNSHPSGITTADESNPIGHSGISNASSRNSLHQAPTMYAALAAIQFIFRIDETRQESVLQMGELPRVIRVNGGVTGRWWKCGSHIREIPEPPSAWRMFTTTSIYYNGGKGYFVAKGGKTIPPRCRAFHYVVVRSPSPRSSSTMMTFPSFCDYHTNPFRYRCTDIRP